jgi:hypothetical protein
MSVALLYRPRRAHLVQASRTARVLGPTMNASRTHRVGCAFWPHHSQLVGAIDCFARISGDRYTDMTNGGVPPRDSISIAGAASRRKPFPEHLYCLTQRLARPVHTHILHAQPWA